jgi:hypothetical protein
MKWLLIEYYFNTKKILLISSDHMSFKYNNVIYLVALGFIDQITCPFNNNLIAYY